MKRSWSSGQLALEDIALGQPDLVLDIPGRAGLDMEDQLAEARCVFLDGVQHILLEGGLALRTPGPLGQLVGRVLHEDRHEMLAGRGHGRIDRGGDHDVEEGPLRPGAVFVIVEGVLDIVEVAADIDGAPGGFRRQAGEAAADR